MQHFPFCFWKELAIVWFDCMQLRNVKRNLGIDLLRKGDGDTLFKFKITERTPKLSLTIGALIVKTTIVSFSYFDISIGKGTLMHILFKQRLRLLKVPDTLVVD